MLDPVQVPGRYAQECYERSRSRGILDPADESFGDVIPVIGSLDVSPAVSSLNIAANISLPIESLMTNLPSRIPPTPQLQ